MLSLLPMVLSRSQGPQSCVAARRETARNNLKRHSSMLYDLHEIQRSFLNPLAAFTDTGSQLFSHPCSPLSYTPVSRHIAAAYELMHRLGKDYEKPAWGLDDTEIDGKPVAVTQQEVRGTPFCKLKIGRASCRERVCQYV